MMGAPVHTTGSAATREDPTGRALQRSSGLVIVVLGVLGIASILSSFVSEHGNIVSVEETRAEMLLVAVESSVQAHLRRGKYHPEELATVFERIREATEAARIDFAVQDGEMILAAEEQGTDADTDLLETERLIEGFAEPRHGGGRGHGGRGFGPPPEAGWRVLPDGPFVLSIARPKALLDTQLAALYRDAAGGIAVALLLVTLLGLYLYLRRRQRQLQTALMLTQERVWQQERLARSGAGLAHETKNPLGIVRGLAQRIGEETSLPQDTRDDAQRIVDETDRIVGQINGFLGFARPEEPTLNCTSLDTLLEELADLVRQEAEERGVTLDLEATGVEVLADGAMLRRAVLNLLVNALAACGTGDTVRIEIQKREGHVTVAVIDTGAGIAAGDLAHVKEPYFTRSDAGTGLGLAIVEEIAHAHGWRLVVDSQEGQGTTAALVGMKTVS